MMAACSSTPEVPEQVEQPVDVLYNDALATALNDDPDRKSTRLNSSH